MRNIVAELRALADREGLGLPDEAADEIERLRSVAALYEELRAAIDGSSESTTHKDAIAEVKWLESRVAELEAARGEPVAWMLKTGHGTALVAVKPKCEVDLWVPLFALKD